MQNQDRREEWRQYHYEKLAEMTPAELADFKKEKALYDEIYREQHRAERAAYKADADRRKRWNANRMRRYYETHPKRRSKLPEAEARQRMRASWRRYGKKNRKRIVRRMRRRRGTEPLLRVVTNLRKRVNDFVSGRVKSAKTMVLIGCTREELMAHLESLFTDGMTWENYGRAGWHVDHKRPCASFDLTDPEQQGACFHYTNLQPLWAVDNLSKGA